MESTVFLIETIYSNIVRFNYLRNKKTFSQFFVALWKSRFNVENFVKKMAFITDVVLNLRAPKNVVR